MGLTVPSSRIKLGAAMSSDEISSKNAAVLVNRASSAYNASSFDQAIEHCRAALIMLDEAYEPTHVSIAAAFHHGGEFSQPLQCASRIDAPDLRQTFRSAQPVRVVMGASPESL
jgi:hypothetical protein